MRGVVVAIVLALTIAGCASVAADQTERSATGVVLEGGDLGTHHLRLGDCIQDAVPDAVTTLRAVPCAREHRAQVLALGTTTDDCFDALDEFVFGVIDRDDLPEIDVSALLADDDDRVVCIIEFAEPIVGDLIRPAG